MGCRVMVSAEVGINHNGDMELAKETIIAAKRAGADLVKFQNYRTEDFVTDKTDTYTYTSQGVEVTETQWEMFKRYELSKGQIKELKLFCDRIGIMFHCTPTSIEGVRELKELKMPYIKIASDMMLNTELVKEVGRTGIPVIMSTGMGNYKKIKKALNTLCGSSVILLHCVREYPTPIKKANLQRMVKLRELFGLPVGYSDHTEGIETALQAAELGACWIEKHFTLSKNLPGPDHWFSANPMQLSELVKRVNPKPEPRTYYVFKNGNHR